MRGTVCRGQAFAGNLGAGQLQDRDIDCRLAELSGKAGVHRRVNSRTSTPLISIPNWLWEPAVVPLWNPRCFPAPKTRPICNQTATVHPILPALIEFLFLLLRINPCSCAQTYKCVQAFVAISFCFHLRTSSSTRLLRLELNAHRKSQRYELNRRRTSRGYHYCLAVPYEENHSRLYFEYDSDFSFAGRVMGG
ncbi:hypothetical protein KQX54_020760 [Cotesia glomerata]|uniref:Uncharacterized protein n=1 Tax=Cotesia glomerata TaxID=32391 RepID=A0AAV7I6X2_COTGL|nr:hypothetical protein KQX54_020760 [Cotesia glomerata]